MTAGSPGPSKLTKPAIVDAAIELADEDGLASLSMRRLAQRLSVGTMSLYRHVADRDELIAAMAVEAGRRFPYPIDQPGPWTWRERVDIAVDADWRLYRAHPWMVVAYASPRNVQSAESMASLRWLAAGFADAGVAADDAMTMATVVWDHINGVALATLADDLLAAQSAQPVSGTDLRARLDAGIDYLCRGFGLDRADC